MKPVLFAVAAASLALDPAHADACSPPSCWPGFFVPASATRVPANLPALTWRPMQPLGGPQTTRDPSKLTLTSSADPSTPLGFTATALDDIDFLIVPDEPLVEGRTYTLTDANECTGGFGPGSPTTSFEVGPAAPLPTQLGSLVAFDPIVDQLQVGTASGSCSTDVTAAQVAVELSPSADAAPWLAVLKFGTMVDGRPWRASSDINVTDPPGDSWAGHARDLVYAVCQSSDTGISAGVPQGEHTITMLATIPGTQIALAATAADPIVLQCNAVPPVCDEDPCAASSGCASSGPGGLAWAALALVGRLRRRRA